MTTTDLPPKTSSHSVGTESDSFVGRLSTGTGAFNVLGPRRTYYWIGAILVVLSIVLILVRGFNFGIDFAGGTKISFNPNAGQSLTNTQVADVVKSSTGIDPDAVQTVGQGLSVSISKLAPDQITAVKSALTSAFGLTGVISDSAVSETWGQEVSTQALISVLVFLIAVAIFIWVRYDKKSAIAAVSSTVQVMIITAGVYALIGFELTPATVIGLLTILGFSLYDTVVVFDKVQENTKGLTSLTRRNYTEAANLAVNQTLMRSINTSLIALLPVAGLLVAGVAILGSGTLKDLALVQLVGMIVGAYSSLFVAVPLSVDLRLREPNIRAHTARVAAKRKSEGLTVDAVGDPVSWSKAPEAVKPARTGAARPMARPVAPGMKPGAAPKPGVRPARPARTVASAPAPLTAAASKTAESRPGVTVTAATQTPEPPPATDSVDVRTVEAAEESTVTEVTGAKRAAGLGKSVPRPTGKIVRPTGKRGR